MIKWNWKVTEIFLQCIWHLIDSLVHLFMPLANYIELLDFGPEGWEIALLSLKP